jgi:hypothetical protein
LGEGHGVFVEGRLNALFRKRVGEGQARSLQEGRQDQSKAGWKRSGGSRK